VSARIQVGHFVPNGCDNARDAPLPTIQKEVELEFAKQLSSTTFFQKIRLRQAMASEIKRRLDEQAPPGALC